MKMTKGGRANQYTPEQMNRLYGYIVGRDAEHMYISPAEIHTLTDDFNNKFNVNRSVTAIAAQLRNLKTKYKLPVKIVYTSISGKHESVDKPSPAAVHKPVSAALGLPSINHRIPALLKELDLAFKDVVRQNDEMRRELRKLAEVRSAIDKYRNGGK
jgi:hypothetical protein